MTSGDHQILVIDYQTDSCQQIVNYLLANNCSALQAGDLDSGLAMMVEHQPDVVLLDLNIRSNDNSEFMQQANVHSPETPIVIMSANAAVEDVAQALRYGACDFLSKPFDDMTVVAKAVLRCVEQGRLRRDNKTYREELEAVNLGLKESLSLLEQDQQAGRHVQVRMLPPTPKQFGDYTFSHRVVPSLYLSGDFVDYFTVGEHHAAFLIADVSGHGASSAFVTVLLKNLFARKRSDFLHLQDPAVLSPKKMLEIANKELLDTEIGKHATLCVGVIDLDTNSLNYSIAGHLPLPILVGLNTEGDNDCRYLQGKGMPVGLFDTATYEEQTEQLPENFILTLFTDGILEVLSPQGVIAQEAFLLKQLAPGYPSVDDLADILQVPTAAESPDDIATLIVTRQTLTHSQ